MNLCLCLGEGRIEGKKKRQASKEQQARKKKHNEHMKDSCLLGNESCNPDDLHSFVHRFIFLQQRHCTYLYLN